MAAMRTTCICTKRCSCAARGWCRILHCEVFCRQVAMMRLGKMSSQRCYYFGYSHARRILRASEPFTPQMSGTQVTGFMSCKRIFQRLVSSPPPRMPSNCRATELLSELLPAAFFVSCSVSCARSCAGPANNQSDLQGRPLLTIAESAHHYTSMHYKPAATLLFRAEQIRKTAGAGLHLWPPAAASASRARHCCRLSSFVH
jgi:hypothetical protein